MEKNLREDYCSYEIAKLLKEKGFDWMCNGYYNKDDEGSEPYFGDGEGADNWNYQPQSVKDLWYSAPTHQMATKWLRKKGWHIVILFDYRYVDEKLAYIPVITPMKAGDAICLKQGGFPTYEEAVEAALKYCLTKLI